MAGVHHAISAAASAALGKKTLKEVVFNASGNFVVPANAIDNTFYVGCTGGGGGGAAEFVGAKSLYRYGGGGSGRVTGVLTLTPGTTIPVTIGAGGTSYIYNQSLTKGTVGNIGGTTSFGVFVNCLGGNAVQFINDANNNGVSGGGAGGSEVTRYSMQYHLTGASSCPAMFTVDPTAIDNTNKFYEAKSYTWTNSTTRYYAGGAGCYWRGGELSAETPTAIPNTGGGGFGGEGTVEQNYGGSGKVVIYYYVYE